MISSTLQINKTLEYPLPLAFNMRSYNSELDQLYVLLFKKEIKHMTLQPVIDANTLRKKMDFMIFLFSLRCYFEIETIYTCKMVTLNFDQNPAISLCSF